MQMIKPNTVRTSFLLSLAALCSLPVVAWTQAAPGNSGPSGSGDTLNPASVRAKDDSLGLPKMADARIVQYSFASDPRLDVKVTFLKQDVTVTDALKALSEANHIKLKAEGAEVVNTHLCLFATKTPLRSILDGMAHLHDWEWKALKDKSLVLHARPRSNQWDGVRPNSPAQAEQYAQGRQFLSQFGNCSPALQSALTDMHHNGVAFSALPPAMQQTVQDMLTASTAARTTDFHIPVPAAENSVIRLQHGGSQEWGNLYYVSVFDGHTGVLLNFPKFNDPNEDTDEIVPTYALKSTRWYGAAEDAVSRQMIAKDDTRLHVPVSLGLQDVPLASCLRSLAAATGLSFAAGIDGKWTEESGLQIAKRTVKVTGKPLTAALDQLATLYGQTWGQTKSGMIVFHDAPEHPAASTANIH